jgi:osmoprotectant transport system permease protein
MNLGIDTRCHSLFGGLILLGLLTFVAAPAHALTIVIGSKKFTESYVLSDIAKKLIENQGITVDHKQGMGGTVILWQALKSGSIALYPEYTGTISEEILKSKKPMSVDEMRTALAKEGIGMTGELGFNNTYALVMTEAKAKQLGIKTLSDLKNHPELRAGPTPEFLGRKDGWKPMCERYGITFADVRGIEHGLGYAALASGQIDLKECYSTDAKIADNHLVVLQDDKGFFPQYKALFLYRLDTPQKAVDAVRKMEGTLDEKRMTALNAEAEKTKNYELAAASYFGKAERETAAKNVESVGVSIWRHTREHLVLVGVSLFAAILVGIPLGIMAGKPGPLSQVVIGVPSLIQTIPQLALLAIMIPLLGIGTKVSIVALFLYSLLPIVRNTATGLQDIPRPFKESAAALGLEPGAQLTKIYLPMAARTILAGIKTSAVINVGAATLAGLIGGGGYGEPIQSGLQLNDNATILQGAVPAAILALFVQFGFDLLDRILIPRGLRLSPKDN